MELDTGWWTIESNFKVWQLGSKCWSAQFERCKVRLGGWIRDFVFSPLGARGNLQAGSSRRTQGCTYIHIYVYIHTYIWCIYIYIYMYAQEIDLTKSNNCIPKLPNELLQLITKPFDHLISETTLGPNPGSSITWHMGCFITLTLPCHWTFWMANSLGLPKHSSIQFTWELAWMWENCSGSKDGGEAWVWRSTVDFFPLQEGMIYVSFFCEVTSFSSLSWWRFAWHKGLNIGKPTWHSKQVWSEVPEDPSQTLEGLGHFGLEDLQHQWQVRYATRCGRDPWEGQLGCNKILQCDLGIQGVDKIFFLASLVQGTFGSVSFVLCLV